MGVLDVPLVRVRDGRLKVARRPPHAKDPVGLGYPTDRGGSAAGAGRGVPGNPTSQQSSTEIGT